MSKSIAIRMLYVGRNSRVIERLRSLFADNSILFDDELNGDHYRMEFTAVSNQRTALESLRARPPAIVMIETDAKPNTRLRFCEMLSYRLQTAAIVSVSRTRPDSPFDFAGHIALPVDGQKTLQLIQHICVECGDYQLTVGAIQLNVATRTVSTGNGRYRMTPKQCALLRELLLHQGEVVTRKRLMEAIWETAYMDDTRTLDVHIRWLRERIEVDPSAPVLLTTVRGVGYKLQVPPLPS